MGRRIEWERERNEIGDMQIDTRARCFVWCQFDRLNHNYWSLGVVNGWEKEWKREKIQYPYTLCECGRRKWSHMIANFITVLGACPGRHCPILDVCERVVYHRVHILCTFRRLTWEKQRQQKCFDLSNVNLNIIRIEKVDDISQSSAIDN